MGRIISSYIHYYIDKYEYSKKHSKLVVDKPANDIKSFFSDNTICPFCSCKLATVFIGVQRSAGSPDYLYTGDLKECPNCSWWTYHTHFSEQDDLIDEVNGIYTDTKHYAIEKSFNLSDKTLPLEVLNIELQKRKDILYEIHPAKMEELVQDILRGVYDCEVEHVGQRGDGGKDLIVLANDAPILVQVKRRSDPEHIELVNGIRELVGTMYIEDARKGIYVTTAKDFSKGSKDLAQQMIDQRKLDYFELINYEKLTALLKNKAEESPWSRLVAEFYDNPLSRIYDKPETIKEYEDELDKLQMEVDLILRS